MNFVSSSYHLILPTYPMNNSMHIRSSQRQEIANSSSTLKQFPLKQNADSFSNKYTPHVTFHDRTKSRTQEDHDMMNWLPHGFDI